MYGRGEKKEGRKITRKIISPSIGLPIRDSVVTHALSLFCTERLSICAEFDCSEDTSLTSAQLLFEHLHSLLSR